MWVIKKIIKEDLVSLVAQDAGLPKSTVKNVVDSIVGVITDCILDGVPVQISGFGTFTTQLRATRVGRNPRTNEEIIIPRTVVPIFKPSNLLKDLTSKGFSKGDDKNTTSKY